MAKYNDKKKTDPEKIDDTEVTTKVDDTKNTDVTDEPKTSNEPEAEVKKETTEVVDEPKKEEAPAKAKKVFDQSDVILCRSVTQGALYLEGAKTGMLYTFNDYGDECEIEYRDLVAEIRSRSRYIFSPYFIVEDEDLVSEFNQLKKFYEENYTVKELADILALEPSAMISALKSLPPSAVETVKNMAAVQVSVGQIDSVRKIKALDEFFGTDLNLISEILQK